MNPRKAGCAGAAAAAIFFSPSIATAAAPQFCERSAIRAPERTVTAVSGIVDKDARLIFDNPLNIKILADENFTSGEMKIHDATLLPWGNVTKAQINQLIGQHVVARGEIDLQIVYSQPPRMLFVDSIRPGGRIACDGSEVK